MTTLTLADVDATRHQVLQARLAGKRIGVVPTMGALHEGHLSLVAASTAACDYTVVTIFVNPKQFGPHEDFLRYPRDLDRDLRMLDERGVDLVFAPQVDTLYAPRHSTFIHPPQVAQPLEGPLRPGHFSGVATIVLKLFQIVPADVAYFGQKDFQQTRVIADMVADLNVPIAMEVCPIIREQDGLAMSSRNVYLSAEERTRALGLFAALDRASAMFRAGERRVDTIEAEMRRCIRQAGVTALDYAEVVDAETLEPSVAVSERSVALVAARVGKTRLIDNILFSHTD